MEVLSVSLQVYHIESLNPGLNSLGLRYEHWFSLKLLLKFLSVFRTRVSHFLIIQIFFKSYYLASFAEIVSTPNVHHMFNCLECTWNSETQDELCSGRVRSEVKSQVVKESGASEDWSGYLGSAAAVALWTSARVHAPQQLLLKPVL